jgi:CRISPR/Cas system-associated endonuclease Cas1
MTNRILDLSDRAARLNVQNALLRIRFLRNPEAPAPGDEPRCPKTKTYRCEQLEHPDEFTVPLADVAVVIVSHPRVSLSHAVLSGLAVTGGIFVACNEKRMPVAMLLPLVGHSLQTERIAAQARASLPSRKRIWQQIVRAKIREQARLLRERTGSDHGLEALEKRVPVILVPFPRRTKSPTTSRPTRRASTGSAYSTGWNSAATQKPRD